MSVNVETDLTPSDRLEKLRSSGTHKVGLAVSLTLLTALLMSFVAAAIKHISPIVSVEMIISVQYLVCIAFMFPWLFKNGLNALKTKHFKLHLLRAITGWFCLYFYFQAIKHIPLVDAVLLRNAAPLCVPVWILFWLKVRIPAVRWLPVMIGLLGIGLILNPAAEGFKLWHIVGFGSAFMMAGSIVSTRVLTVTEPASQIMFYYFFLSCVFSLPMALSGDTTVPLEALPYMIGIGLFMLLSMWCYTKAYQFASATIISPISYFSVVFTGLLSWLFWDQVPTSLAIAGAVLVVLGGVGSVLIGQAESPTK